MCHVHVHPSHCGVSACARRFVQVLLLFIRVFDFLTQSESLGVLCIVLFKIFVNDVGVFLLLCAIIIAYTFDDPWRALLTLLPLMTRGRCAIIIVGFSTSFWLLLAGAIANSDAPQET